ncbi:MliC family protein [Arvimicrobium flavum]|uniref:MliC family protein n=1 Tax=Arvimicrobium flavum TaxID=3393320 RepID=UPI00237C4B36|nr:MliC family protein [Mesorhizobium shangrilense]
MRLAYPIVALLWATAAAHATSITIDLPGTEEAARSTVAYACDPAKLTVEYITTSATSLAVVMTDKDTVVMSRVPSASGVRYAGENYVWWTKGRDGSLYDVLKGDDAPAIAKCTDAS